jgi:hypothetical protein
VHVTVGKNTDSGLTASPANFHGLRDNWTVEDNQEEEAKTGGTGTGTGAGAGAEDTPSSSGSSGNSKLYDAVVECRVIKTPEELQLLRHVNRVSSEAHMAVMSRYSLSLFLLSVCPQLRPTWL